MRAIKKKWELALLPITIFIAIIMITALEGCKNEDTTPEKQINQIEKTKKENLPKKQTPAKEEPKKADNEVKDQPQAEKNTENNDKTEAKPSKLTDFTGDIVICLSNMTFGWVQPCG